MIKETLGANVSMFVRGVIFILVLMVVLLIISPELTGMVFAGVIPQVLFSKLYSKWMRNLQRAIQNEKGRMNTVAEESFSNIRTVKAFSNESAEYDRFAAGDRIVYVAGRMQAFHKAIFGLITQLLNYGSMAAVLYIASLLYKKDKISIGEITAFMF